MQPVDVQRYIQRATDFFLGMQLMREDEFYRNSSALLAIHSAISYTDALRVSLGEQKLSSDNHREATEALQKLLPARRLEDQTGSAHLNYLVSNKGLVAYGSERLTTNQSEIIFTKAERFARWANKVARHLKLEGWQHDDH